MRIAPFAALAVIAAASRASAQGRPTSEVTLPEPVAPAPRVVQERGPSPVYYRRSGALLLPLMRIAVGLQGRLPGDGLTGGAAFAADVYGGAVLRFGRGARAGLLAELGYSYAGFSEHLASLGVGLLQGIERASDDPREDPGGLRAAIVPHLLLGSLYDAFAVGARTSVIVGYRFNALEIAHQVLFAESRAVHEVHVVLTSVTAFGEAE